MHHTNHRNTHSNSLAYFLSVSWRPVVRVCLACGGLRFALSSPSPCCIIIPTRARHVLPRR